MKNLFIFLLGISILTSCSNDTGGTTMPDNESGVVTDEATEFALKSTGINPVLKQLYIDKLNSQSYHNYDTARAAFYNTLGANIPDSELGSSDKMLRWVQNNLTQTGFQSYQEASDKYDDLKTLGVAAIQDNLTFHQYLASVSPVELVPILNESIVVPTDCSACVTGFMNCINIAHEEYSNTAASSASQFVGGGMQAQGFEDYHEEITLAYIDLQRALSGCDTAFDRCCTGGI